MADDKVTGPVSDGANLLRRIPLFFPVELAPGAKVSLVHDLGGRDCTVEKAVIRIYAGARNQVKVMPYKLQQTGHGDMRHNLIHLANVDATGATVGKTYIDGDDDRWEFEMVEPVRGSQGESICVDFQNDDPANTYDAMVILEVDYMAGARRSGEGR